MRFNYHHIERARLNSEGKSCATARRNFERLIESEQAKDMEAGRVRGIEQILADRSGVDAPPLLSGPASSVLASVGSLGRDMNGGLLMSEKRSLLDEWGVKNGLERSAYMRLFGAYETERSLLRLEEKEAEA